MRVFKYRAFHKWIKSEKLTDAALKNAVDEIERGLFEAYLGNHLYKKRIARKGSGKRSGYRTLLAFKKNDRDNISYKEEVICKKLSDFFMQVSEVEINELIKDGELFEVIL